MTDRRASVDRRAHIVQVTLELLGKVPLSELTTRQIAAEVGISQPGLFNHFASRDAIVLAALDHVRDRFAALAADAVAIDADPERAIDELVGAILRFASENPGLPRLMFQDAGAGTPFRAALAHLMAMQQALFGVLVQRAQRSGAIPASVDPAAAGPALLAVVQGSLVQGLIVGEGADRVARAGLRLWWAGVRAVAESASEAERVALPPPPVPSGPPLVRLDVRPLIAGGTDPLAAVLAAIDGLPSPGVLEIVAPFRPAPLIALLSARGYAVDVDGDRGVWRVLVRSAALPAPLDLRDLPAPEPFEAILVASAGLPPGASLLARTPRLPSLLLPHLVARGLSAWAVGDDDDGLLLVARDAS